MSRSSLSFLDGWTTCSARFADVIIDSVEPRAVIDGRRVCIVAGTFNGGADSNGASSLADMASGSSVGGATTIIGACGSWKRVIDVGRPFSFGASISADLWNLRLRHFAGPSSRNSRSVGRSDHTFKGAGSPGEANS